VRKKLGNSSLRERGSAVAENETREILKSMRYRAADMAAPEHAGPTTPITGGTVGNVIACAPLSAACQSH